ncbi:L-lactate permease [Lactobacillus delbrueckii]|uniref:L-lactate permease n=1 Tax=Lactobacillus delbrueckii TaxID=1584 RepID=UPI001E37A543|nr:L-lactate permease [Lactobacillus delbrueckii]MCD5451610.1 L-lactate permease [Lactobacillus delbrueckii subsp. lactis]
MPRISKSCSLSRNTTRPTQTKANSEDAEDLLQDISDDNDSEDWVNGSNTGYLSIKKLHDNWDDSDSVANYNEVVSVLSTSPASILMTFGINPIEASVICLVANTTPTAFGAVGLPVITLAQTAGLDVMNTAFVVSLQLSVLILVIPYILVGLVGGGVKAILYLVGLATGQLHF